MYKVFLWSVFLVLLASPASADTPDSTTYRMDRVTVAAGATMTTSSTWDNSVVISQEGPNGVASFCGQGAVASFGFWSVLGDIPMPIRLDTRQNGLDPLDIDLLWSGNASSFQVYRTFTPDNVLDPVNLYAETANCDLIDLNAIDSDIIFYKVVPKP